MERRIAVIMRWLERCLNEYRAGSLESALMDAECARADIETLRQDVWAKLERRHGRVSWRGAFWGRFSSAALSVLLLLLLTASPLSTVPSSVLEPGFEEGVSADELSLWSSSLRRDEQGFERRLWSEVPLGEAAASKKIAVAQPPAPSARGRKTRPGGAREAEKERVISRQTPSAKAKTVAYDRMFSLLQTGSRALKNEEPIIKIDRDRDVLKGEGGL